MRAILVIVGPQPCSNSAEAGRDVLTRRHTHRVGEWHVRGEGDGCTFLKHSGCTRGAGGIFVAGWGADESSQVAAAGWRATGCSASSVAGGVRGDQAD